MRKPVIGDIKQGWTRSLETSGPEVIKKISYSTQLSMKFELINMKISRINRMFMQKKTCINH